MYCWGNAQQGALGLGGIEELKIPTPKWNKYLADANIETVACGQDHTVILLDNGTLFSCGNNEFGQLGHEKGTMRPAEIDKKASLANVKCGLYHTVMITIHGRVLVCGDNTYGQLSFIDSKYERIPRDVALPNPQVQAVQVACGGHHTLVLLRDSRVYSWGRNNYGQLGHSEGRASTPVPRQVKDLESVPINRITAGGAHNFALSVSGNAFGWGRNSYGQLGVSSKPVDFLSVPTQFCLENIKVKYISCGEEHTVALVTDGRVFTCGSNLHGQLGRTTLEETSPIPSAVPELMGSTVTQIACGKYHTVVLLKESGRLLSFGLNRSGQLGCATNKSLVQTAPPFVVEGDWLPHSSLEDFKHGSLVGRGNVVRRVFAGGNQSFATIYLPSKLKDNDMPYSFDQGITFMNESPLFLCYELLEMRISIALVTQTYSAAIEELDMFFTSPSCINGSFLKRGEEKTGDDCIEIDLEQIRMVYELLLKQLIHIDYSEQLHHNLFKIMLSLIPRPIPCSECLRAYCFLMCHPSIKQFPECVKLLVPFIKVFLFIEDNEKAAISDWLFKRSNEFIMEWIEIFRKPIEEILKLRKQNAIESKLYRRFVVFLTDDETWALQEGIKILKWLYLANMDRGEPIDFRKFYVDNVADFCDLREDYIGLVQKKVDRVVFSRYYFVLNGAAKAEVLQADAGITKSHAQAQARADFIMNTFLRGPPPGPHVVPNPDFCALTIHRERILADALNGLLSHSDQDFKKPLMVKFFGEDGIDEGGVTKEFFMLLMKEILNPMYGLFYEEDESRYVWFREQPSEFADADLQQFFLVGMICGLAIYNGVNLDLPFPLVVYKKLLGGTGIHTPTLDDLVLLKPSVGKHLTDMLEMNDETFEQSFPELTFEVTRVFFGSPVAVPLLPNGSTVTVNKTNRQKYVQCYMEYELIDGIKKQFEAFFSGFKRVFNTECTIYQILHPEELMSFIVGSTNYDFEELKDHSEYLNGYTSDHKSIGYFWDVVSDFPIDAKKKLLIFWTGSDRIPITGIKSMRLRIQRMDGGPHFSRLPVAHTCANILDLPPYPTPDVMRDKLLKAIHFTSGFGII